MTKKTIKQAFILGGGLGTRLRPITDTIPKVMVDIAPGKPLLEHAIGLLRAQGIDEVVLSVHYLADTIVSHFGDGKQYGIRIRYIDDGDQFLETGGALKKAEPLLDEDFIFMYGDHLHFFDIAPLIEAHAAHDGLATVVVKTSDFPENGDILEFDTATKRIVRSHPRPHGITEFTDTRMLNSGIFALSKKIINAIPADKSIKFDGVIVPQLISSGAVLYAFPTDEPILDIGTPEKYALAKAYYQEKSDKKPFI